MLGSTEIRAQLTYFFPPLHFNFWRYRTISQPLKHLFRNTLFPLLCDWRAFCLANTDARLHSAQHRWLKVQLWFRNRPGWQILSIAGRLLSRDTNDGKPLPVGSSMKSVSWLPTLDSLSSFNSHFRPMSESVMVRLVLVSMRIVPVIFQSEWAACKQNDHIA